MPIYEYACQKCDHHFEDLVSSHTSPVPPCPACASQRVEKLLSAFAVGRASPALAPCGAAPASAACGPCGGGRGMGACGLD